MTEERLDCGSEVKDRDGYLWRRGVERWAAVTGKGGGGMTAGTHTWEQLESEFGPVTVVKTVRS